jgi:hypothetical protein
MDISPAWIQQHSVLTAWLLGICASAACASLGYVCHKTVVLYRQAQHAFTNCIPTIQRNTGETAQAIRDNTTKMDVLIQVLERK